MTEVARDMTWCQDITLKASVCISEISYFSMKTAILNLRKMADANFKNHLDVKMTCRIYGPRITEYYKDK